MEVKIELSRRASLLVDLSEIRLNGNVMSHHDSLEMSPFKVIGQISKGETENQPFRDNH